MREPADAAELVDGAGPRATVLDGFRLGGGTFTRLPMSPPRVVDGSSGRIAVLSAPAWGFLLGAMAGGLAAVLWWWFERAGDPGALRALLSAALAVVALAWLTRGLHLDGLADTVDGFASMRQGPEALAVMRDPHVGALGAAGLSLVVLLQVVALAVLISQAEPFGVLLLVTAVAVLPRGILPWLVRSGTPSAETGLGAVVVGSVSPKLAAVWALVSSVVVAALLVAAGLGAPAAALSVIAALMAVVVLRTQALRRFGVLSGDVLGAAAETATLTTLLVAAVAA